MKQALQGKVAVGVRNFLEVRENCKVVKDFSRLERPRQIVSGCGHTRKRFLVVGLGQCRLPDRKAARKIEKRRGKRSRANESQRREWTDLGSD